MTPYYTDTHVTIYHGDCRDIIPTIGTVDAVVTDPPYGLGFMGKAWDAAVPPVAVWIACLNALRPGGHLLAFAGTRTHHRMACRIEDAGFDIRDMIAWVYGSGFPKSLDVSKAIDKAAGAERQVIGLHPAPATPRVGTVNASFGEAYLTAPATPEAQQWAGWGTALKPALEPITMARKPLTGTVAANVLEHGTGALNVDGCRVRTEERIAAHYGTGGGAGHTTGKFNTPYQKGEASIENTHSAGRWPANLIHDGSDEVVGLFPQTTSGDLNNSGASKGGWGMAARENLGHKGSTGSAARFFYTAKASAEDRDAGCPSGCRNTHPTVKPTDLMAYLLRLVTPPGGLVLDPFAGSGTTGKAAHRCGFRAILIERDERYCEIAAHRCAHEALPLIPAPAPASPAQAAAPAPSTGMACHALPAACLSLLPEPTP